MKRHDQDELLRKTLSGEEVSGFRAASLASGMAAVRKRRRYRRAVQFSALAILTLLVALGIAHQQKHKNLSREVASTRHTPPISASPAPSAETAKVKIISDEELFALFPGRAMALVGKPGEQQLVFLDGGAPRAIAR